MSLRIPCDNRINRLALVLTKKTTQKYADHMLSVEHGMGERETSSNVSFLLEEWLKLEEDKYILEFIEMSRISATRNYLYSKSTPV